MGAYCVGNKTICSLDLNALYLDHETTLNENIRKNCISYVKYLFPHSACLFSIVSSSTTACSRIEESKLFAMVCT